jgi:hypothetical protein
MKKALAILAAANAIATFGQTTVHELDFAPPGLTGANERPLSVGTTATGGEFDGLPSMSLDTSTHEIFLNYAWGTVNGFTDLTGTFIGTRLFGPADAESTAESLYNLTIMVNTQSGVAGGVFGQRLQLTSLRSGSYTIAQQESDLLHNKWYIDVQSSLHPDGEIRGQLTAVPEPRTYSIVAGMALLGFGAYRRFKKRSF